MQAAPLTESGLQAISARAWTLFASVSVLWGIPYLFIRIAVDVSYGPASGADDSEPGRHLRP